MRKPASAKPRARRSQTAATARSHWRRRPARTSQLYHAIHSTTTNYTKSGQISHGEKFGESSVIMTHKGKIARLPLAIREQLNRRLQDGEIGKELVVWLNAAPE